MEGAYDLLLTLEDKAGYAYTHWSHEGNELIEPFFPGSASTVQMNHCLHCMKSFSSTADWN
jgi:hypothetical protein